MVEENEAAAPIVESSPSGGSKMMLILGAVVLIAIVGFGLMSAGKSTAPTSETEGTNSVANGDEVALNNAAEVEGTSDASMAGEIQVISVEAGSFYYKPNVITVKKGEKVKIEMKSVDMMHDFNIDELEVKMPITKSGETGTVEFTASEVGEFEIYCSVGQHRKNGQVGKLIVTE